MCAELENPTLLEIGMGKQTNSLGIMYEIILSNN